MFEKENFGLAIRLLDSGITFEELALTMKPVNLETKVVVQKMAF